MRHTSDHSPARRRILDAARRDLPPRADADTEAYVERLSYRMFIMIVSLN